VPAVAQILAEGLDLGTGVTVLAGENGAGKSTVVEVIAEIYRGHPLADRRRSPRRPNPGARSLGNPASSLDQLELVASWRQFLVRPQSFLRHLLDEPPA
jgi:predicted ATPase